MLSAVLLKQFQIIAYLFDREGKYTILIKYVWLFTSSSVVDSGGFLLVVDSLLAVFFHGNGNITPLKMNLFWQE